MDLASDALFQKAESQTKKSAFSLCSHPHSIQKRHYQSYLSTMKQPTSSKQSYLYPSLLLWVVLCAGSVQAWVPAMPQSARIGDTGLSDLSMVPDSSSVDEIEFISDSAFSRRNALSHFATITCAALTAPSLALADDTATTTPVVQPLYVKKADKFAYQFQPPPNFDAGNKPLKTHLDEINFKSTSTGGYQYGITVDPVRIASLADFGTPEQVAAKVVLAEVNRDGVFDVTLMKDPFATEPSTNQYYQLNYLSKGKRGEKRFITKFYVKDQFLLALTAQCKEADYPSLESEMLQTADSFVPV